MLGDKWLLQILGKIPESSAAVVSVLHYIQKKKKMLNVQSNPATLHFQQTSKGERHTRHHALASGLGWGWGQGWSGAILVIDSKLKLEITLKH